MRTSRCVYAFVGESIVTACCCFKRGTLCCPPSLPFPQPVETNPCVQVLPPAAAERCLSSVSLCNQEFPALFRVLSGTEAKCSMESGVLGKFNNRIAPVNRASMNTGRRYIPTHLSLLQHALVSPFGIINDWFFEALM